MKINDKDYHSFLFLEFKAVNDQSRIILANFLLDIKYKKQLFLLKESTIILWSFDYLFSK
jgi:hypothetical protein